MKQATLGALGLALIGARGVDAQGVNGSFTATATVQSPIAVTGAVPLNFQSVFPGVVKTVAYSDVTAGRFDVTGQASTLVTYSFTLPLNLTNAGQNLPIGSWTGYVNTTQSTSGGTAITPSVSSASATLSVSGTLSFYIGATVTPPNTLPAGSYTGTVTLTVSY
jgi:Domain of unknown function (DUF4402)